MKVFSRTSAVGLRTAVVAVGMMGCAGVACGELLANGDFENNSAASTLFNLSNADFSATMADSTAFGTGEELDIVTGLDFGVAPISGDWKVGLHSKPDAVDGFDAFSLDLLQPVASGTSLTLSFFAVGEPDFGSPLGTVDIGLSSSATSFGTLVFSGTPTSTSSWTFFTHSFSAPVDATFLTVRVSLPLNGYAFVDAMSLVPTPGGAALISIAGLVMFRRRRRT